MQHPPVLRQTPSPEHSSGTRLGSRNRPAHRPPRLDFSNQTTCSGFVPTASVSSPSPQAIRLAMDFRPEVESHINTTFSQYAVKGSTTSYPTPSSGDTTGTDYFITVEVNTRVQTDHFTGEARYMQLTVYVDKTCIPSLKQFQFVK